MNIQKIQIIKSKTVGVMSSFGKTRFKKIQIMAQAEVSDKDDVDKAYEDLSDYIENKFQYEEKLK
jgi:hemerythrin